MGRAFLLCFSGVDMLCGGKGVMQEERRDGGRARLLQRARIVLNGGFTAFDCVILDISEGGARLKLADWINLPRRFELRVPNQPPRLVEIRHRGPQGTGVRFV
jgi:hypothetical protein